MSDYFTSSSSTYHCREGCLVHSPPTSSNARGLHRVSKDSEPFSTYVFYYDISTHLYCYLTLKNVRNVEFEVVIESTLPTGYLGTIIYLLHPSVILRIDFALVCLEAVATS